MLVMMVLRVTLTCGESGYILQMIRTGPEAAHWGEFEGEAGVEEE